MGPSICGFGHSCTVKRIGERPFNLTIHTVDETPMYIYKYTHTNIHIDAKNDQVLRIMCGCVWCQGVYVLRPPSLAGRQSATLDILMQCGICYESMTIC